VRFCPIKHAQKISGIHTRHQYFLEYGDAIEVHQKFEEIRLALITKVENNSKES
jgi:hypothetical protein